VAKVFSVASWNVEHFKDDPTRIQRVIDFLDAQDPDVFGLYEVEGKDVFQTLVTTMPGYLFQITEGAETQEILVGVRRTLTAFITQKTEFKSGTTHMRPGQLVTITKDGINYAILFLHVASGSDPRGMGLRDDMIERALEFRKVLDESAGAQGPAKYLFLGDLNTMGMIYPFERSIKADIELQKTDKSAARIKIDMRRLVKTHDVTWSNGSSSSIPPSNLDHVFASTNLNFNTFPRDDGGVAHVSVRGWVDKPTPAEKDLWISQHSDHSLLFLEVES
jgi:exonuclease III